MEGRRKKLFEQRASFSPRFLIMLFALVQYHDPHTLAKFVNIKLRPFLPNEHICTFSHYQNHHNPFSIFKQKRKIADWHGMQKKSGDNIWNGFVIESPQNQNIKLLKKLQKNKREREKHGKLVLEGFRLLMDSVEAGFDPEFVIISDDSLETKNGKAVRELLKANGKIPMLVSKAALIKEIHETKNPQGILAVVKKPSFQLPEKPSLLMICDNINDPGNLGTIVRTAASVPVDGVVLLGDCCDIWSSKALRASMGAVFRVPIVSFADLNQLLTTLAGEQLQIYAASGDTELLYFDIDWNVPSVLIVGSEANGLGNEIRGKMKDGEIKGIKIPLANGVESLNAGVAGSMILGEILRQRQQH